MRYLLFLFILIGFASADELDRINKTIHNKHVPEVKKMERTFINQEFLDNYHRENVDEINSVLENIDKESDKIMQNFKPVKPDKKAVDTAEKIKKDLSQDKIFQEWVYRLTQDIFYKGKDRKLTEKEKEKVSDFASYVYLSIKNNQSQILSINSERIYIFMSSSVPKSIWKNYVRDLRTINNKNIYIVLRGCIGEKGCKYLKPTLNFIKDIAYTNEPSVDTTKPVNIIIDPYLFRYYKIQVVPTFVYAKGVYPKNSGVTEGIDLNLKTKVNEYYSLKGDVSIYYFVSKLINDYKQNSEFLKNIEETLSLD